MGCCNKDPLLVKRENDQYLSYCHKIVNLRQCLSSVLISSIKLMKSSSEVKRHFENLILSLSLSLHAHCLVVSGLQTKENLLSVIRYACLNLTLYV